MDKALKSLLFPNVFSKFGAPMGRPVIGGPVPKGVRCQRVPLVDYDYDPGGAYWGGPANLFVLFKIEDGKVTWRRIVRAKSNAAARAQFPHDPGS